jgi:thermitase
LGSTKGRRAMVASDDRPERWRERRAGRLRDLGFLRFQGRPDRPPAYYVAGELLVRAEHRGSAERVLAEQGHTDVTETAAGARFRRYCARDLDVLGAASAIRQRATAAGDARPAAGANHVFLSSPFEHGGPFGPPVPATSLGQLAALSQQNSVRVAVIDTGVWSDSPLPPDYYEATATDYESTMDVNADGVVDGDVGHANFIAGVIAQRTPDAKIRIIKVLDTFGVCTEADLVSALDGLDATIPLINLSLGGYTVDGTPPIALRDSLDALLATGDRIVAAAAGNDGLRDQPFWPAAFAGSAETWHGRVVAVAAHDGQHLCSWSNLGDWVTLAAPGSAVTSTYVRHDEFSNGWAQWSGTSFATPYVLAAIVGELARTGSAAAALTAVLATSSEHLYDGFPGLP